MTSDDIVLTSEALRVVVSPGRGGEIHSISSVAHHLDLLLRTPWAVDAERTTVPDGVPAEPSQTTWNNRYAGGWQMLFPHAGAAQEIAGVRHPYHGEAAYRAFNVCTVTKNETTIEVVLQTAPITIRREFSLHGAVLRVTDEFVNNSPYVVEYDHVQHVAFGAPFLGPDCEIETGARTFTSDPTYDSREFERGRRFAWPNAVRRDGFSVRLDEIPPPDANVLRFGWLEDFAGSWISLRNRRRNLTVKLEWFGEALDYAWFWLEAGASRRSPWHGQGYALGLEPSSTQTSGAGRRRRRLRGHERFRSQVTFSLHEGRAG
jgi:hypothetical protein